MRVLATADLHFDHQRSRLGAIELIDQINGLAVEHAFDTLLLVGDTARGEGDRIEEALARFRFDGPKLFVSGNHELWTQSGDSHHLITRDLPRRVRAAGWQWLQGEPFARDGIVIAGSIGWYDYSFAAPDLGIAKRFYEAKVSPGAAERLAEHRHLIQGDEPDSAMEVVGRWNDGRFVRLGRADDAFLAEVLAQLDADLEAVSGVRSALCAVHHVPFAELLPPRHGAQWDFARAYLGSPLMGLTISRHANVKHVLCGHSHFHRTAEIGGIRAVNIGSGYRQKRFELLEL